MAANVVMYTDTNASTNYTSVTFNSVTGLTSNHVLLNDSLQGASGNVTWSTSTESFSLASDVNGGIPSGLTYYFGIPE